MLPAAGLLVHNRWSLISPGTERMLVEAGGANLLNTARQRPDLVGRLTWQLFKAAACRVFGIDLAQDKIDLALACGADDACLRSDPDLLERVRAMTDGRGADAVLLTAATTSHDPVQLAAILA